MKSFSISSQRPYKLIILFIVGQGLSIPYRLQPAKKASGDILFELSSQTKEYIKARIIVISLGKLTFGVVGFVGIIADKAC